MKIILRTTPSQESQIILDVLQQAVAKTLERKRRLGHYYVIWRDEKPVMIGEDAPKPSEKDS